MEPLQFVYPPSIEGMMTSHMMEKTYCHLDSSDTTVQILFSRFPFKHLQHNPFGTALWEEEDDAGGEILMTKWSLAVSEEDMKRNVRARS